MNRFLILLLINLLPLTSSTLQRCEGDCDYDTDCGPLLLCADQHKDELKAAGLHPNTADCPPAEFQNVEYCFDRKLISGGGGGDPHFRTYDGTNYNFHGECDLNLARITSFGGGLGLDVHIRTEIVDGWSLISNAAIRVGDEAFELMNDGSYYLNGKEDTNNPFIDARHYNVSVSEEFVDTPEDEVPSTRRLFISINLGNDDNIHLTLFKKMISVRVDVVGQETEGMLGVRGKKGLVGRDRITVLKNANEMGFEWQVNNTEPMLFQQVRAPQYPEQCILPSVNSRLLMLSDSDRTRAEDACHGVAEEMFEFCLEDIILTGDSDLAHNGEAF